MCGLSIALGQRTTSTIATTFLTFVLNLAFALSVLDLTQEFLRQFSFNTIVNVSRKELEALR